MKTIATLFSGFEGFGIGAKAAGYRHLWGVEWDAQLAAVAQANGFNTIVGDVCAVDYSALERPNHLHASPVCKNASIAKADGKEEQQDLDTAAAVSRAILALRPDTFSLENVRGYRDFQAFKNILHTLRNLGYSMAVEVVNAADYGVPQTRERLIVLARRDGKRVQFPAHTHAPADEISPMFDTRRPWVGWLEAIADIVDTLPADNFAPWQLKRLPAELRGSVYVGAGGYEGKVVQAAAETPAFTVTANTNQGAQLRAFIVDGQPAFGSDDTATRDEDAPAFTIGASQTHRPLRAYLTDMLNTSREPTVLSGERPSMTVTAGFGRRPSHQPVAAISGRVVKMTPRALARFQSFPDWYQLPDKTSLACTGIGNAVPCLLAQRLMEAQA